PDNVRLDLRKVGKSLASCDITFRHLTPGYEYSPEWSERRTLYFSIFGNRIESVRASEARNWQLVGYKSGVRECHRAFRGGCGNRTGIIPTSSGLCYVSDMNS